MFISGWYYPFFALFLIYAKCDEFLKCLRIFYFIYFFQLLLPIITFVIHSVGALKIHIIRKVIEAMLRTRGIIELLISRSEAKRWQGDITYYFTKKIGNSGLGRILQQDKIIMASKNYLPYYAAGKVVSGFGRGSKSLGCPTANFPEEIVEALPAEFETGIYFGWALLEKVIHKMVTSIGWNPFYNNDKKSMEIHLLHKFNEDFYGKELKVIILGYIRPEKNFSSVDELIEAIQNDIDVANKSLDEPRMMKYKEDPFLNSC